MKTRITLKTLCRMLGILMTIASISDASAQQNLEVEDGKLIVNRISASSIVEIASGSATGDAQVEFGDNGSATDAIIGWDNSTSQFSMTTGSVLNNGGINISSAATKTVGIGTDADANAKVWIRHNSTTTSPQLILEENNNGDLTRMQFRQFSISDLWQLSSFAGANPEFTFTWDDDGTPHDILTLDGDGGNVIVEDGKLEVKEATGTAVIEVSSGGANSDAQIEFGNNGSANQAVMGWDNSTSQLVMTTGSSLNNSGISISNAATKTIGLGTSADANARVLIQHNSDAGAIPSPQLIIRENNNTDFARLQFDQNGVDEYWHIAAQAEEEGVGADPKMNIFYWNGSSGNNVMVIDGDNADVGIDRTPTTNDLEVNGTASKTVAGEWLANSDRRIKTDIRDIDNSFETMLKLHPVKFKYTEEWMARNPSIKDQYYYNFIAQEYQQIFPEAVQGSGEYLEGDPQEILQIDTYNAQIVNMVATQELIRENQIMKDEVASLKAALDQITLESHDLKAELHTIKSMLNQIDLTKAGKPSDD